jgi:hypothetical protein
VERELRSISTMLLAIHSNQYSYRDLRDYAERIEPVIRRNRSVSKVKRISRCI